MMHVMQIYLVALIKDIKQRLITWTLAKTSLDMVDGVLVSADPAMGAAPCEALHLSASFGFALLWSLHSFFLLYLALMRLDFVAPIIPPTVVDLTPCGFILTLSLSNKRQAGECDVEEKTFKPVQSASVTCHADRARSPLAMSLQTPDAIISRSIPVNASGRQRGQLESGPAAVVQGGARPSHRFTSILGLAAGAGNAAAKHLARVACQDANSEPKMTPRCS